MMRHLPLELELDILEFALPPPSFSAPRAQFLRTAALVCPAWTSWAHRELHRNINITTGGSLESLVLRLERDGACLGAVRSLSLGGKVGPEWTRVDVNLRRLLARCETVGEIYIHKLEHNPIQLNSLATAKGLRRLFISNCSIQFNPTEEVMPAFPALVELSLAGLAPNSPAQGALLGCPSLRSLAVDHLSPIEALTLSRTPLKHLLQTSFSHTPLLLSCELQAWGADGALWVPPRAGPLRVAMLEDLIWSPGEDLTRLVQQHPQLKELYLPQPSVWLPGLGGKHEDGCWLAECLALCARRHIRVHFVDKQQPAEETSNDPFNPRFWSLVSRMK